MERVALIHVCARPLHNGLLINNKNDQPIEVCARTSECFRLIISTGKCMLYITKTMNGHLTNIIVQVSQFNANENVVKCLLRFLLSRVK
jgi:hypothetical protein